MFFAQNLFLAGNAYGLCWGKFWSKTAKKKKKHFKKCVFREFLKMLNGGPGPGPVAVHGFLGQNSSLSISNLLV